MNEQDRRKMQAVVNEHIPLHGKTEFMASRRAEARAIFTAAIEYRDSLTCEWGICDEGFTPIGFGDCYVQVPVMDEKPKYCPNCGRRVVTK